MAGELGAPGKPGEKVMMLIIQIWWMLFLSLEIQKPDAYDYVLSISIRHWKLVNTISQCRKYIPLWKGILLFVQKYYSGNDSLWMRPPMEGSLFLYYWTKTALQEHHEGHLIPLNLLFCSGLSLRGTPKCLGLCAQSTQADNQILQSADTRVHPEYSFCVICSTVWLISPGCIE